MAGKQASQANPAVEQPVPAWHTMDAAARERAYSPSSCIGGDYRPFIAAYGQRSAAARARCAPEVIRYGPGARQELDFFAASAAPGSLAGSVAGTEAKPAPLLVFIHGGYWQELSKNESSFAALPALAQGFAFAAVGYTLAPQASLAEIIGQCRAAVAYLQAQAARLGIDPQRVVVAGSSAGAHLAAMVALGGGLAGAVLVSGIYELEPLVGTPINTALGLDRAQARQCSPALQPLRGFPSAVVCWGEHETDEFKRQGQAFAAQLVQAGSPCQVFEAPQRNHFDVVLDLADTHTRLGQAVAGLLQPPS